MICSPDDHQVVGQDAQETFAFSTLCAAIAKCGTKASFVSGEVAFAVAALSVGFFREVPMHFQTVFTRRSIGTATPIYGNDRFYHPKFMCESMQRFTVVSGIGREIAQRYPTHSLLQYGFKKGGVIAWALTDCRAQN